MPMLSVNSARRIAEDLNKDRHVKKRVEKLLKKDVTAEILREIKLEEALARHAWHPQLSVPVQGLLTKYLRILRADDEAKKAEKQKLKQKKESKKENELIETENEEKKPEPKLVVKMATPCSSKPQDLHRKVPALRIITNIARSNGVKRKNDSVPADASKVKHIKMEEEKENEFKKMDVTPMKPKKTSKKSGEDHDESIKQLVKKIKDLPVKLSSSQIEHFLEGVTADELRKAEENIGRNLKRLDQVWWFIIERDFRIARDMISSNPRSKYIELAQKPRKGVSPLSSIAREPVVSFKKHVFII